MTDDELLKQVSEVTDFDHKAYKDYERRMIQHKEYLTKLHDDVITAYKGFMKHRMKSKYIPNATFNTMFNVLPTEYTHIWQAVYDARGIYGDNLEYYLNFINREKASLIVRLIGELNSHWAGEIKDYRNIKGDEDVCGG